MNEIRLGEEVSFVDKYGVRVSGTFVGFADMPLTGKRAIVRADAFGDGMIVDCAVPLEALEKVAS